MSNANPHRGEVALVLGGTSYALRPSYEAIVEWEERLGRGTTEILMRIGASVFRVHELAAIVGAAARAGGATLTDADAGRLIVADGQVDVIPVVARLLKHALTGGKEAEPGEAGAAGTGASPSAA
ncbi:gene transfer agent family protein [Azospirillum sp. sgz302134]